MDLLPLDIRSKFQEIFHQDPLMIRSPGRINLIGEHTDYNEGFVMPAAVDREIYFGISASADHRSFIYSLKYKESIEVNLDDPRPVAEPKWANYLLGVLFQFKENGYPVKPFCCVFGGNVPLGAGMSSSAALECGFAFALSELNRLTVPKPEIIAMAQWSEHHYAGVKCGIMDQFASVMGKEGHAIVLDCRSLTHRYSPLDLGEYGIILCDTKVKHSLVDSAYNTRRKECESGVKQLQKYYPEIRSLRDVSMVMLDKHRHEFDERVYNRCLYVVQEILRVQRASHDLENRNLKAFGEAMFATHYGLAELFEVSCQELDFLVSAAQKFEGVLGARMMGGGFGGCTINLVKNDLADAFVQEMEVTYKKTFSIEMSVYRVRAVDGTGRIAHEEPGLKT